MIFTSHFFFYNLKKKRELKQIQSYHKKTFFFLSLSKLFVLDISNNTILGLVKVIF